MNREAALCRALVQLADTLVVDFDVVEILTLLSQRCVEVLDVDEASLLITVDGDDLRVVASSGEASHLLELFQLEAEEGPCLDCFTTGRPLVNLTISEFGPRWPRFGEAAGKAGFTSVHALPMRLRDTIIGALNLFKVGDGELDEADVVAAQALADIATIAILQHRTVVESVRLNEQLSRAFQSRITIEQAKGMVAEHQALDVSLAFQRMRVHARNHNLRLNDVAADIIAGQMSPADLDALRDA